MPTPGPSAASALAPTVATGEGAFAWWREADSAARRAFIAAALGWMLDSFDVMLYSLVLAALIQDPQLQLSTAVAGQLGAITLLSAAAGGVAFGVIADRIGRKRALMAAVLIYSIFTAACGLAQTVAHLAVFRIQKDGRLEFARRYDVAVGRKPLWWAGLVPLPLAASR